MKKSNTLFNVVFALLFTVSGVLSAFNLTKMANQPTPSVSTTKTVKVIEKPINYNTLMRKNIGPSVVKLYGERGGGTGFHVQAPSGKTYILTNAHVCELHTDYFIKAAYKYKRKVKKRIIEIYDDHDLCLVEGFVNAPAIQVSDKLIKGETTFLVGHPSLRPLTVTQGEYIYNTNINISYCGSFPFKMSNLGIDLDIFKDLTGNNCIKNRNASSITNYSKPGASGSPIVNTNSKLVGVLFAGSPFDQNDSYAVPLKDVKRFLKAY